MTHVPLPPAQLERPLFLTSCLFLDYITQELSYLPSIGEMHNMPNTLTHVHVPRLTTLQCCPGHPGATQQGLFAALCPDVLAIPSLAAVARDSMTTHNQAKGPLGRNTQTTFLTLTQFLIATIASVIVSLAQYVHACTVISSQL